MREFFSRYRRSWYSLFSVGGSSSYVFGINVFGNPYYDKRWFKATILPIYNLGHKIHDAKWRFLHRFIPRHRYNIIRTDLPPGYYDEDTLILHACFAMLGRYIESNGGSDQLDEFSKELVNSPDPNAPEGVQDGQAMRQTEATRLWRWWTIERPANEKRRDDLITELYGGRRFTTKPVTEGFGAGKLHEFIPPEFSADEKAKRDELGALKKKIEDDEQAMLHRLIDIRRSLWT